MQGLKACTACRDFGCNICGEGGEYETLTLDCPLFTHGRILLEAWEVVEGSPDPFSPVGHLRPQRFHVQPKDIPPVTAGLHPHVQPKDPPGGTAGCRPPAALPGGAEQGPGAQLRSEPSAPGAQASSCESSPPGHTPAGSDTEIPQQQQQHEDQETAQQQNGHAGPGRVIQVPSLLPAASSAADRARQPGQPPPMAAEAVLSVSSHAVHAACSPRFASSAESEASQSAAATGQALSHALQVISKGELAPCACIMTWSRPDEPVHGKWAVTENRLPMPRSAADKPLEEGCIAEHTASLFRLCMQARARCRPPTAKLTSVGGVPGRQAATSLHLATVQYSSTTQHAVLLKAAAWTCRVAGPWRRPQQGPLCAPAPAQHGTLPRSQCSFRKPLRQRQPARARLRGVSAAPRLPCGCGRAVPSCRYVTILFSAGGTLRQCPLLELPL